MTSIEMVSNGVNGVEQDHVEDEPAKEITSPSTIKATPKKRGATKANSDESPTKKMKAPGSGKKASLPAIPTRKADVTEADRACESWGAITAAFESNVGVKVGSSTCRLRYAKMKANLACVEDEDMGTMKTCIAQVEADIAEQIKALHRKKWAQVSAAMKEAGTQKYEPGTIEKAFKAMGANGSHSACVAEAAMEEDE
ncbi:hypothetical protein FKW77_007855 [Venturia effusa]|uniref:Uncharacterized protein n=1 Tax=Venturia effusa TaxID=50376 RepID=A0A517L5S5_9PEZI|nr:hypothetical protein FKW77_007855 [Venturia effusa]